MEAGMPIFMRFRSYKKPESGCKKERIQEGTTKVVPSKMKDIKKGNHICGSLLQKGDCEKKSVNKILL